MAGRRLWIVDLAEAATLDFHDALRWTSERFGEAQAAVYEETLTLAIDALTAGPKIAGVRPRDGLMQGLMSLHVARRKRKGRHVVLFRIDPSGDDTIQVLRLLHDSMDFARHLKIPGSPG